jgi:hypothetical protein
MKVKELIERLKTLDPEAKVICQRDSEGNGYSPLHGYWQGAYKARTEWWGDAGLETLTEGNLKAGFTQEDVIEDGVRAVFLIPIN